MKNYLYCIYEEAHKRGYNFNVKKIELDHADWIVDCPCDEFFMTVTKGQLEYEWKHLGRKLYKRSKLKLTNNINECWELSMIKPHPLFTVIEGDIESWEKRKEEEKKEVKTD